MRQQQSPGDSLYFAASTANLPVRDSFLGTQLKTLPPSKLRQSQRTQHQHSRPSRQSRCLKLFRQTLLRAS